MTNPLGFVVLARRPNPYREDPWDYWAIGRLFPSAPAAITALAKGELADDIEREAVAYRIDRDSAPNHRHHRECIHNLTPEDQIAARGRSVEWWRSVGAEWPKQIQPGHWQCEPKADPVEYVVQPVGEWNGER